MTTTAKNNQPVVRGDRWHHEAAHRMRLADLIRNRMSELNMSTGDVVRASKDFGVRLQRDLFSRYTSGECWPRHAHMVAIAQALRMELHELDPSANNRIDLHASISRAGFTLTTDPEDPDRVFLQLHGSLPFETANRLIAVLGEMRPEPQ